MTGSYSIGLVIVLALLACGAASLLLVARMKAPVSNVQSRA
ncbi:hypothetical protein [Aureimonas sp. AU22]|nr:hypothetical protein [Aureimonas sp. AU22]